MTEIESLFDEPEERSIEDLANEVYEYAKENNRLPEDVLAEMETLIPVTEWGRVRLWVASVIEGPWLTTQDQLLIDANIGRHDEDPELINERIETGRLIVEKLREGTPLSEYEKGSLDNILRGVLVTQVDWERSPIHPNDHDRPMHELVERIDPAW